MQLREQDVLTKYANQPQSLVSTLLQLARGIPGYCLPSLLCFKTSRSGSDRMVAVTLCGCNNFLKKEKIYKEKRKKRKCSSVQLSGVFRAGHTAFEHGM